MSKILQGVRVLDFGWVWSAPMTGAILASLGAEVIRVESRNRLEPNRLRSGDMGTDDDVLVSFSLFRQLNVNKKSMTLDMKHERAEDILKKLLLKSDMVIENFSPGVIKKLGVDYKEVAKENPGFIMLSLAASGQNGPKSHMRAYAPTLSSLGGLESLVGYSESENTGMLSFGMSDPNAGVYGAFAVLGAYFNRLKTGKGVYIDFSQMEAVTASLGEAILEYQITKKVPHPRGNDSTIFCPNDVFPCRGNDQWVAISVHDDMEWVVLQGVVRDYPWNHNELNSLEKRLEYKEDIKRWLTNWTIKQDKFRVAEKLQSKHIPAAPVLDIVESANYTAFKERNLRRHVLHPTSGDMEELYFLPWHSTEGPLLEYFKPAPKIGEDTENIVKGVLGLSDDDFHSLVQEGVFV